jgi:hypothetical protein
MLGTSSSIHASTDSLTRDQIRLTAIRLGLIRSRVGDRQCGRGACRCEARLWATPTHRSRRSPRRRGAPLRGPRPAPPSIDVAAARSIRYSPRGNRSKAHALRFRRCSGGMPTSSPRACRLLPSPPTYWNRHDHRQACNQQGVKVSEQSEFPAGGPAWHVVPRGLYPPREDRPRAFPERMVRAVVSALAATPSFKCRSRVTQRASISSRMRAGGRDVHALTERRPRARFRGHHPGARTPSAVSVSSTLS